MALTVLQRPLGFILGDCHTATIDEAYAGFATVNRSGHGLIDGDYVYVISDIEQYNGFWYVNIEDGNKFKIRQYATATDLAFVVNAAIQYCDVTLDHGWNSVHLPIAYRLRSNIYPTNEVDTERSITALNNDNGYTAVTFSGALGTAPFPEPFESVKITGTSNINGIYQIVDVINSTTITINLAYDDANSFAGGIINRYYDSYNVNVRLFAGLDSGHALATDKPFELLAELNFTPDENNEIFFSVSEILKSHINTRNNLQLSTLPNNLDFFTSFYITYAESYDDSLGSRYRLTTFTSDYTNDAGNFTGYAINSKLPFKNIHSGSMSDYVDPIKFLTLFTSPIKLNDKYFDLSFINNGTTTLYIRRSGSDTAITNYDQGVYRVLITEPGVYSIFNGSAVISNELTIVDDTECTPQDIVLTWLNYLGGFEYFTFKAEKEYTVEITDTQEQTKNIMTEWPKSYGVNANTIRFNTVRNSRKGMVVRSQYVTQAELEAIQYIKTSPLVQIVESRSDRRTVIVDNQSFTVRKDRQDLFEISFDVSFTDDIPSQRL
jgi:hypothetical protein